MLKAYGASGGTLVRRTIAFGRCDHHRGSHDNGCGPHIAEACRHFTTVIMVLDVDRDEWLAIGN